MSNDSFTLRLRRSWVRLGLVVAVTAAIAAPIGAYAADRFGDVPATNIFHDDITWLAEAGVTQGCNPPANDQFCPGDNVTREQMAAFMRRLANSQAVDAGTLEGVTADGFVQADQDIDAATLEGVAAAGFVQAGQPGSVNPAMTTAEPGVAQSLSGTTVNLVSGAQSLLEVTVEAPAAGYVLVSGSADVFYQHTTGTNSIAFMGVSNQATVLGGDENKDLILDDAAPSGLYSEVFSMQKIFSVAAGSNTFYLLAEENVGVVQVGDMQLSAVYFPTAYGSVAEVPAAAPTGTDELD